jgi:hypothetical protein
VDPDPAFHSDADADPAFPKMMRIHADSDPQQRKWAYLLRNFDFFPHFCVSGKASSVSVKRAGQVRGVTSNRKRKAIIYKRLQSNISVNVIIFWLSKSNKEIRMIANTLTIEIFFSPKIVDLPNYRSVLAGCSTTNLQVCV